MLKWWYAQNGDAYGPVPVERLRTLIVSGELAARNWLWTPGMPAWERASTLPAFTEQIRAASLTCTTQGAEPAPPTLPSAIRPRRAGPWARFWAQWLDIYLVRAMLMVLLALAGFRLERDGTRFLGFVLMLPVGLMVQALLLSTIGTTPGKALLGLRVRRWDDGLADRRTLLRRQGLLWFKGLALGLPVINLITLYQSKQDLDRARLTRWDEAAGTDVYQDEHKPGLLFLCAMLIVIAEGTGQVLADMAFHRLSVWHLP